MSTYTLIMTFESDDREEADYVVETVQGAAKTTVDGAKVILINEDMLGGTTWRSQAAAERWDDTVMEFRNAVELAEEAAEGDSNDDEIEALQNAVSIAENLVDGL